MSYRWVLPLFLLTALTIAPASAQCPQNQLCVCTGDCNHDGEVDIVELQGCVNGFLGDTVCTVCDADLDDEVGIVDLQGAVNTFLDATTCPTATLAALNVGSATGARGTQVTVPINLKANAEDVVVIAPLRLSYNATALDFVECTSALTTATAVSAAPSTGVVSIVLYPDPFAQPPQGLTAIPNGQVINCKFAIKSNAPTGPSPVGFVFAGMSDGDLHDFTAEGSGGTVSIQ